MDQSDDLDDLIARTPPMTEAEKLETLLGYFSLALDGLKHEEVLAIRELALRAEPCPNWEETVIAIIDGELALRNLDVSK